MRRRAGAAILLAFALAALSACGASGAPTDGGPPSARHGRAAKGGVALRRIGGFENPTYVTGAPGEARLLFVVEQRGTVEVLRNGRRAGRFLDISALVSSEGERGLLSIAFPPDYARSGRVYAYYTDREGDIHIDEFHRRTPTRVGPSSRRTVIEIPHRANSNHNGGQMQFLGPLLYFGTGDGGSGGDPPNNAQNRQSLLGKLLRIDPIPADGRPYSIPASNPFAGSAAGRGEIYSYGFRNPFRFSFDTRRRGRPRIAIADVGQDRFEELDYLPLSRARGANFGWDAFEGFAPYSGENSGTPDPGDTVKPVFAYSHDRDGSCSIIGGYVVRDPRLRGLRGRYVYADYCEGRLRSLAPRPGRARGDRLLGPRIASPTSFGEDDLGRLYVASEDGPVYRLVPR
jgi:glucose/arabinose dehydrogenase